MNMLFKLWLLWQSPKLGSDAFYPLPTWIKNHLVRYPLHERVVKYARMLKDVDMSSIAPDEYGCAESVTRLLRNLNPDITGVITYTPTLREHMESSSYFIKIDEHIANVVGKGVIVIASTQPNVQVGHVGVLDNGRVWSNNSYTGAWSNHWSWFNFVNHYKKLEIEYYLPI